ncbi:MAG: hypothetical protein DWH91_19550 [Planctomycetota bacterium]|nr:MAG: hypothetical protein DWH91_19550 [Planctomycetota bacterium]
MSSHRSQTGGIATPVCFVSDLHLFSKRSRGHLIEDAILAAARRSRVCVLGGDIFDFKWSMLPSTEATLAAACLWLSQLATRVPECQFHFVLGNHDDHPSLVAQLPDLASQHANFRWDRFYYRMGDTVFLHGDAADRRMSHERLELQRNLFSHTRRRGWAHGLYSLVVRAQMHRIVPHAVYPRAIVAARLIKYLKEIGHGPEAGVRQVCFGHTHRPLDNYHRSGIDFHNGGAPIGRALHRIVEVMVTET